MDRATSIRHVKAKRGLCSSEPSSKISPFLRRSKQASYNSLFVQPCIALCYNKAETWVSRVDLTSLVIADSTAVRSFKKRNNYSLRRPSDHVISRAL
jgi:hypothetical protein